MTIVQENELALSHAPVEYREIACPDISLMAIKMFEAKEMKADKEIIGEAIRQDGLLLKIASDELKADKDLVMTAVELCGEALEYAADELKSDPEVVQAAVKQNGEALKFASEKLRSTKEIVLAAVRQKPITLRYALGGLNQDNECLAICGIFDDAYDSRSSVDTTRVVMSTRFSLGERSSPYATTMALGLKRHPFFQDKDLYFPNGWDKGTCDPDWTNIAHRCRGTFETCEKADYLKTGVPKEKECCWRYSFRYQLERAKRTNGFMIQVEQYYKDVDGGRHILGDGQQIETEMAEQVGVKVFRVQQEEKIPRDGEENVTQCHVDNVVECVGKWERTGRADMRVTSHILQPKPAKIRYYTTDEMKQEILQSWIEEMNT